ncbi:MAG TPA: hypothetical protein DEB39_14435 [Planctomycetaceae bacterium]|nr:hypothetical protein [Planctomycetaceae bacterium]
MRIAVIVEGNTEKAFKGVLLRFLETKLPGKLPKLDFKPSQGRVPKEERLQKDVERHLKNYAAVIALTDVYTGSNDFETAEDAKQKMRTWVGEERRFYPHAAQYEFEAWLLPYWEQIKTLAKTDKTKPSGKPEDVNHGKPPSKHIAEAYRTGQRNEVYDKVLDAPRVLKDQDLTIAVEACPELKAFVNTILALCDGEPIQ